MYTHTLVFSFSPFQAGCDGREDVLRQWLGGDETDGEEQTDGGEEREGERESESLKNIINAYDSFGLTLMHYAARFNRFEVMCKLVKKKAGKMEGREKEDYAFQLCVHMQVVKIIHKHLYYMYMYLLHINFTDLLKF